VVAAPGSGSGRRCFAHILFAPRGLSQSAQTKKKKGGGGEMRSFQEATRIVGKKKCLRTSFPTKIGIFSENK
jgi:hypothetical protein